MAYRVLIAQERENDCSFVPPGASTMQKEVAKDWPAVIPRMQHCLRPHQECCVLYMP
jgi:hypothetical protein